MGGKCLDYTPSHVKQETVELLFLKAGLSTLTVPQRREIPTKIINIRMYLAASLLHGIVIHRLHKGSAPLPPKQPFLPLVVDENMFPKSPFEKPQCISLLGLKVGAGGYLPWQYCLFHD